MVDIPREQLKDGISIVKRNVLDLAEEANRIIRTDSAGIRHRYAYLFIQLAIEEFGKALIMKEELQNSRSDIIHIDDWVFAKKGQAKKIHVSKFDKAWEVLDKGLKEVHRGVYEKNVFDPNIFDTNVDASHELRLKCIYVDYDEKNKRWDWFRVRLDKDKLLLLIDDIETKAKTILTLT